MNIGAETSELEEYPRALFHAISSSYRSWLQQRLITLSSSMQSNAEFSDVLDSCESTMRVQLLALLKTDVDNQRTNPLHVLRESTAHATEWLRAQGVTPAQRDEFEIAAMPNDVFAIGPLTWKDLSEDVHEAGISWGAWKAAVVLTRRRQEGKISS